MAPGGTAFPLSGHTTRHRTWPVTHARAALPGQPAAFLQRRPRLRRPGRRGHGDATDISGHVAPGPRAPQPWRLNAGTTHGARVTCLWEPRTRRRDVPVRLQRTLLRRGRLQPDRLNAGPGCAGRIAADAAAPRCAVTRQPRPFAADAPAWGAWNAGGGANAGPDAGPDPGPSAVSVAASRLRRRRGAAPSPSRWRPRGRCAPGSSAGGGRSR